MPVPSSGPVAISDLVDEFGGTAPHSLSEYYRGGSFVPGNNTNVPTAGAFGLSNARGAVNEIAIAATSGANIDISSLFGANWTSTVPKRLTIGSGVTIGGTGSSAALIIPANMAGTLEIDNAGSIIGKGGAANGGAGGHAISNSASGVTINNTGLLAGGGGGGGLGGVGGNGSYTSTSTVYAGTCNAAGASIIFWDTYGFGVCGGQRYTLTWSAYGYNTYNMGGTPPRTFGGATWAIYETCYTNSEAGDGCFINGYRASRTASSTVSTTGGSGGSGGVGQGYTQTNASGASGASGGTNAGTGGTGGAGATYGNAGATGSNGANGNASNGSAGSAGGAAGAAVIGTSVSMNNTGTLYGAVA